MIKLIEPNKKYIKSYMEAYTEYKENNISTYSLKNINNEDDFFKKIDDYKNERNLKPGIVGSNYYWLVDDSNNKFIGELNIRHELTDKLLLYGGHIGFAVRYSEWNKGYGTTMLKEGLKKAKELEIKRVLITCRDDNLGSARVIEKNGGILENKVKDENGTLIRRYWISLKKRYVDRFVGNKALKTELKLLNKNNENFNGDVYFYNFIKVKNRIYTPNGKSIIDNDYKWLEFYDYSSRVKLTAIYEEDNEIFEWYFDIARGIGKDDGIPYEDDMYLDVVVTATGEIILLDEDELKEAFERKEMTKDEYDEAYKIANDLMAKLKDNKENLKKFTDYYLNEFLNGKGTAI